MNNVKLIKDVCSGCGTCVGVCPQKAVSITFNKLGFNRPIINKNCIHCGLCLKCCPINHYPRFQFEENISNYHYGYGASVNLELRRNASSGGIITELLIFLLDKNIIDYAIVINNGKQWFIPEVCVTNKKEDIINSTGSKYIPIPLNEVLLKIRESNKKYAIVGLPCQIQGLRLAQENNLILRKNILYMFGLFCNHIPSLNATKFLAQSMHFYPFNKIRYRGKGWPGIIKIENEHDFIELPYRKTAQICFSEYPHQKACNFCMDPFSRMADISFADAYFLQDDIKKMGEGQTFSIVRNKELVKIIYKCKNENKIMWSDDIKIDEVNNFCKILNRRQSYIAPMFLWFYKNVFRNTILNGFNNYTFKNKVRIIIFCTKEHLKLFKYMNIFLSKRRKECFQKLEKYILNKKKYIDRRNNDV